MLTFHIPIGIVVGVGAFIGNNVVIYQNVTIGAKDINHNTYPIIHDNIIIYGHSTIVGGIDIGKGAIIGAHSLVLNDVEPYSVYAGCPARLIKHISVS